MASPAIPAPTITMSSSLTSSVLILASMTDKELVFLFLARTRSQDFLRENGLAL